MPPDSHTDDLWAWQTTLDQSGLKTVAELLRAGKYNFASSGLIALPDSNLGFSQALLVRDPDGHLIRLIQK